MGNALRLFVFCLALALVGTTATLSQLWVNKRASARHSDTSDTSPHSPALRAYQHDQQGALAVVVGLSLLALVAVAATGGARTSSSEENQLEHARQEMQQVEQLAKTTVAQEAALVLERAERRRTDENLHLQQLLLNKALAEKIRLGRDLHDGVIQSLYATGLTLESARQKQTTAPAEADALFDRGIHLLNQSIREIRSYIQPLTDTQTGLPDDFPKALDVVLANLKGDRDVDFAIRIDENAATKLAAAQLPDVLQIVRESVSNAMRHGAATQIQIRLHQEGEQLALLIQDNGTGFDPVALAKGGHGLVNFRARATTLGANLKLDSRPGHGTRIALTFPVHPTP